MTEMDPKHLDPTPLDDELAAMTDALMERGAASADSEQARELEPIIKGLHGLMRDQQVSDAFAARLTQRLDQEWQLRQRSRHSRRSVLLSPTARLVSLAAALVLVFVTLLLWSPTPGSEALSGTVVGDAGALIGAVLLVGAAVLVFVGIFIFRGRR
ncbi:hypothetical protein FBR02_18730 [Anaerolineae bacterium CFX9]|nr:hypothetical protein [Anaerolineae bacterium CFX9]